ncbi:MAG: phytanoyl-CoA dioxygenase family protein [Tistlia sp.]|uniref:phytanoyl-CoA dioxygenase family protein n=1 Tax=Tistlia sp. TaxID=3057121 RepID=UPI0034A3A6A8
MPKLLSQEALEQYERDGFYFPLRAMTAEAAQHYRQRLEAYERTIGSPINSNYRHKVHLLFTWANELVHHPTILDAAEDVLGPNLLCWTTNFFIKEPHTSDYVSWHQDSTYWGLSSDEVMTAWVALSDAPVESGAMKFWPGSHKHDQFEHRDTFHENNLLSRGQEIAVDVPADQGVLVPLSAGEFSLHHVKLVHGSEPNRTDDRRIGLAIRYIPTHVRQLKADDSAMLVRGVDTYNNFAAEPEPVQDLDAAALASHADAIDRQVKALYQGTDRQAFRR